MTKDMSSCPYPRFFSLSSRTSIHKDRRLRRLRNSCQSMVCFQRHSKQKMYKVQKSRARSKGFCDCCGKLPVIKCRGLWLCSKFIAEEPGLGEPVMVKALHTAASSSNS